MKTYAPLKNFESVVAILSKISFLGGVSDAQLEEILGFFEVGSFKQGEFISRCGEEPSHVYIIKSGKVDLLIVDDEITYKKRSFSVGDNFGEAAMLSMDNHTASFVAAEDCELIMLSRRAFNELRHKDPSVFSILMMNFARELARKLQYTDTILLKHEHDLIKH